MHDGFAWSSCLICANGAVGLAAVTASAHKHGACTTGRLYQAPGADTLLLLLLLRQPTAAMCRGSALGVTLYPSYFSTGQLPMCANWVFIFEKTLPDQGGRSKIDGLLCDGGATLTHEIGHQMVSVVLGVGCFGWLLQAQQWDCAVICILTPHGAEFVNVKLHGRRGCRQRKCGSLSGARAVQHWFAPGPGHLL